MNQRQKQMLETLINQDDYITVQTLADQFHVSLRTAHNDLKEIEEILYDHEMNLSKKPKVGIKINAPLSQKKSLLNYINPHKESIEVLSTKMRRMKIFARLLSHSEGTSLNKLSDEFLVSKTSIVSDFEIIEKKAKSFGLKLIKDRKGTRIQGDEKDIRHALSQIANDFVQLEFEEETLEEKPSRLDLSTYCRLKNLFDNDHIEIVENIILDAEKKLGYTVNDLSYVNLITHLLILINRLKKSISYSKEESNKVFQLDIIDKTMAIAHNIAFEISQNFSVDVPESEIKYIYQYLVCSGIQSDFIHLDINNYSLNIEENYLNIVDQMITFVSDIVHYDLRQDKELKLCLLSHIIPLMQRLKYNITITNPLINEIKVQYSAMFSIVALAVDMMNDEVFHHLSQDEIGF
ncbi:MAG: BglG family transcription antiterminator, partial [Faecalibacillus sp.]